LQVLIPYIQNDGYDVYVNSFEDLHSAVNINRTSYILRSKPNW
jgi:hypothetical protein